MGRFKQMNPSSSSLLNYNPRNSSLLVDSSAHVSVYASKMHELRKKRSALTDALRSAAAGVGVETESIQTKTTSNISPKEMITECVATLFHAPDGSLATSWRCLMGQAELIPCTDTPPEDTIKELSAQAAFASFQRSEKYSRRFDKENVRDDSFFGLDSMPFTAFKDGQMVRLKLTGGARSSGKEDTSNWAVIVKTGNSEGTVTSTVSQTSSSLVDNGAIATFRQFVLIRVSSMVWRAVEASARTAANWSTKRREELSDEVDRLEESTNTLRLRVRPTSTLWTLAAREDKFRPNNNIMSYLLRRQMNRSSDRHGPRRLIRPSASAIYGHFRLMRRFSGHQGYPIFCLLFDKLGMSNGASVITGADDYLVKVWSASTGQLRYTCRGHKDVIVDVVVDKTNMLLASASNDKIVRVWDLNSDRGVPVAVLRGHRKMVNKLAFDSDMGVLISCSDDGDCRVWDLRDVFRDVRSRIRGDVSTNDAPLRTNVPCAVVTIYQLENRSRSAKVFWVVKNPKRSGEFVCGGKDGVIHVVLYGFGTDAKTGRRILLTRVEDRLSAGGHRGRGTTSSAISKEEIIILSYGHCGRRVLSICRESNIARIHFLRHDEDRSASGREEHEQNQRRACNVSDIHGKVIVLRTDAILGRSESTDQTQGTSKTSDQSSEHGQRGRKKNKAVITFGAWTCDGRYVVTSQAVLPPNNGNDDHDCEAEIRVWCGFTGELLRRIRRLSSTDSSLRQMIWILRPHPIDPRIVLSTGDDGRAILWNIETGRSVWSCVVRHPGGQTLIGATPGASVPLADASFSKDGNAFAVSDRNGRWSIFTTGSEKPYASAMDEQYFMDDYSPLRHDEEAVALDESGGLMPHLLPRTPLCNHALVPYTVQPDELAGGNASIRRALRARLEVQSARREAELAARNRNARRVHTLNDDAARRVRNNRRAAPHGPQYRDDEDSDFADDGENGDLSSEWSEASDPEEESDDDPPPSPSPERPVRRRRLVRGGRNRRDEHNSGEERTRVLRTRNSTVRIVIDSTDDDESDDDNEDIESDGAGRGGLRPLQRRRYDVDNFASDADGTSSEFDPDEDEQGDDDEDAKERAVWDVDESKDTFSPFTYKPQVGDVVMYVPSGDPKKLTLPKFVRDEILLECKIVDMKFSRRSDRHVLCDLKLKLLASLPPHTHNRSDRNRRMLKRRNGQEFLQRSDMQNVFDRYHPDRFVPCEDASKFFSVVLSSQNADAAFFVAKSHYYSSIRWLGFEARDGVTVHVPFDDGKVYEGKIVIPKDLDDQFLDLWESVGVKWSSGGSDSRVSPWEIAEAIEYDVEQDVDFSTESSKLIRTYESELSALVSSFAKAREFKRTFAEPVCTSTFPLYTSVVCAPMDLSKIKRRLDCSFYRSIESLYFDVRLIAENCRAFNSSDSKIVKIVEKLESRLLEEIGITTGFRYVAFMDHSASSTTDVSTTSSRKRRRAARLCRTDQVDDESMDDLEDEASTIGRSSKRSSRVVQLRRSIFLKVLDRLQAEDTKSFFGSPVTDDVAPNYSDTITEPMDFGTLRGEILRHCRMSSWSLSVESFSRSLMLIFSNALQYNLEGDVVYNAALGVQSVASTLVRVLRSAVDAKSVHLNVGLKSTSLLSLTKTDKNVKKKRKRSAKARASTERDVISSRSRRARNRRRTRSSKVTTEELSSSKKRRSKRRRSKRRRSKSVKLDASSDEEISDEEEYEPAESSDDDDDSDYS